MSPSMVHGLLTSTCDGSCRSLLCRKPVVEISIALAMQEMRHSADVLAAGLLEMADPELSSRYFRQKTQVMYDPFMF